MIPLSRRVLLMLLLMLPLAAPAAAAPELDLAALKGKVVYLDFWASWCSTCRQSFPWMKAMHDKYGKDGLVIVAVNVDQEKQEADAFLAGFNPAFRIVFDPRSELVARYKVLGMPTSLLVDRRGKVRLRHQGFQDSQRADYEQEIRQLLAETP